MTDVVAVATSGGRDSIALLHATLHCAKALGLRVVALHVHHGLMPDADAWASNLEACCTRWADLGWPLSFACTRLTGRPGRGDSVEAWARRERYAALARMARKAGASLVLLAHHRRDQAETVLLQALRGAGPAGLAAMPRSVERDGLTWARPWLAQPAQAIDAYVEGHGLLFVVDPSNADPRHARSRLRASVMPPLREAFPEAETALATVARQAHEARTAARRGGARGPPHAGRRGRRRTSARRLARAVSRAARERAASVARAARWRGDARYLAAPRRRRGP
jgi:tRNA(Ile)-lysidine synthase